MEYNKTQFSKTSDKKVLHKVRKNWVVLSTALLMALGGGAVVASGTTSANADANNNNGNNNTAADGISTLKNRINANLTKGYQQSNQNAKTVPASSKDISNQANALHNRILANASTSRNNNTANGRQAANNNNGAAELNHRIQESVTAPKVSASYNAPEVGGTGDTPNYSSPLEQLNKGGKNVYQSNDNRILYANNAPITLAYENSDGTLQRTKSDKARIVQATVRVGGYKNNQTRGQSATPDNSATTLGMFTLNPSDERYQVTVGKNNDGTNNTQSFSDNFTLDPTNNYKNNHYVLADTSVDSPSDFSASFGSDADEYSLDVKNGVTKVSDTVSDKNPDNSSKDTLKSGVNWDHDNNRPLLVLRPNKNNPDVAKATGQNDNNIIVNYVDQNGALIDQGQWGDKGSTNDPSQPNDVISNLGGSNGGKYGTYIDVTNPNEEGIADPDTADYLLAKTGDSANDYRNGNAHSDFATKYMYQVTNYHQNITIPLVGKKFGSDGKSDNGANGTANEHNGANPDNRFSATIHLKNHEGKSDGSFTVTKQLAGQIGNYITVKPSDVENWLKSGDSAVHVTNATKKANGQNNSQLAGILAQYTNDPENLADRIYVHGNGSGTGTFQSSSNHSLSDKNNTNANTDWSYNKAQGKFVPAAGFTTTTATNGWTFDANAKNTISGEKPAGFTVHYMANVNGNEKQVASQTYGSDIQTPSKSSYDKAHGLDLTGRYGDVINLADTNVNLTKSDASDLASDNYGIMGLALPDGYHFVPGQDTHYAINSKGGDVYYYLAGNSITPHTPNYQRASLTLNVQFKHYNMTTHQISDMNTSVSPAKSGMPAISNGKMTLTTTNSTDVQNDSDLQNFLGMRGTVGQVYTINPAQYDDNIKTIIKNEGVPNASGFSIQPSDQSNVEMLFDQSGIKDAKSYNTDSHGNITSYNPYKNNNISINYTVTENPENAKYSHIYVHYVTPSDPYDDISTVYDSDGNVHSDVDTTVSDTGTNGEDFGDSKENMRNEEGHSDKGNVPEGYQFVKVLGTNAQYNLNNHHTISNHDSINPANNGGNPIPTFTTSDQNEVIEVVPKTKGITVNYVDQRDNSDLNYNNGQNKTGNVVKTVYIPGYYGSVGGSDTGYSRYGEEVNLSDGKVIKGDLGGFSAKVAASEHKGAITNLQKEINDVTGELSGATPQQASNIQNTIKNDANQISSIEDPNNIPDDAVKNLKVPNGYHITQESTHYTFNHPGKGSNMNTVYNIMVAGNHKSDTASDTANINIWEENPSGEKSSAKLAATVPDSINGDVDDTYSINANEFTPSGYTPNPANQEVNGTILQNGLSGLGANKTANFYYMPSSNIPWNELGDIYVTFIHNTTGDQVGSSTIAPRSDGYEYNGTTGKPDFAGEPVNVMTRGWDGFTIPAGWKLDPSDNTNTSFSTTPGQVTPMQLKVYNPSVDTSGKFNIIQNLISSDNDSAHHIGTYTQVQGETGKQTSDNPQSPNSKYYGTANGGFDVYGHNYKVRGFKIASKANDFANYNGKDHGLSNTSSDDVKGAFTTNGIDPQFGTWDYIASRTDRKDSTNHPSDNPTNPSGSHQGPNNPNNSDNGSHTPNQPGKFGPNTSDAEPIYVQFYQQLNNGKEVPIRINNADGDNFTYLTDGNQINGKVNNKDYSGDIRVDGYMDQSYSDVARAALSKVNGTQNGGSVDAPNGYHLMDNPKLNYTIDHQAQQVDLDIRKTATNEPAFTLHTVDENPTVSDLNGQNNNYTQKQGKNYTIYVSDNSNDILKPSDYLPTGYTLDKSNNRDKDITVQNIGNKLMKPGTLTPSDKYTAYKSDTFYYKQNTSNSDKTIQPIEVSYINQNGQNVTMSEGHKDDPNNKHVDYITFPSTGNRAVDGEKLYIYNNNGWTNSDAGPKASDWLPTGYSLASDNSHLTNPVYGDTAQHVDVMVQGNSVKNAQFTAKLALYGTNGKEIVPSDNVSNTGNSESLWNVSGNVGDVVTITPSDVLKNDSSRTNSYHIITTDPNNVPVQVQIDPNGKLTQLNGANIPGVKDGHVFDAVQNPSNNDAGSLNVLYKTTGGTLVGQGLVSDQKQGTYISDVTTKVGVPGGWQLVPNQNKSFTFPENQQDSTKVLRVEGNRVTSNNFKVTLIGYGSFGSGQSDTPIHSETLSNVKLDGHIGDYTPVDAGEYITQVDKDFNGKYSAMPQGIARIMFSGNSNSPTLTPGQATFYYRQNSIEDGKPMYVRYWDQNGKLVNPRYTSDQYQLNSSTNSDGNETTNKKADAAKDANGHYIVLHHKGDPIEEITAEKDFGAMINVIDGNGGSSMGRINDGEESVDNGGIHGVGIPAGYRLATTGPNSNPDQRTIYTFDNDLHVINLNVAGVGSGGNSVPSNVANTNSDNTVTIHIHKNHMNNGQDANNGVSDSHASDTIVKFKDNDVVGSHDILNPANYAPKGYHNTLSDQDAIINKDYSTTDPNGNSDVKVNGSSDVVLKGVSNYQYPNYSDNMNPDYAETTGTGKDAVTTIYQHDNNGNLILFDGNNKPVTITHAQLGDNTITAYASSHSLTAKPDTYVGRVYVAPKNVYFNYDQDDYQAAPLKVVYVNQNGNQVGRSDTISGSLDQIVNVADQSDGGLPVPSGYKLDGGYRKTDGSKTSDATQGKQDTSITNGSGQEDTSKTNAKVGFNQDLDYGLTSKPQTVYLHVTGNDFSNGKHDSSDESDTVKPMTIFVIDHNADGTVTVDQKAFKPVASDNTDPNQPIKNGDTFKISPTNRAFAPNLSDTSKPIYHLSNSDATQYGQIGSDGTITPNQVTFNYYAGQSNQGRVVIHYYNSSDNAPVGNPEVLTGTIGGKGFKSDINSDYLPAGYQISGHEYENVPHNPQANTDKFNASWYGKNIAGNGLQFNYTNSPQDIYVPVDGVDYGVKPYTIYLIAKDSDGNEHVSKAIHGSDYKKFDGKVGSYTEINPYDFITRESTQNTNNKNQALDDGFSSPEGLEYYHVDPQDQDVDLHVDSYGNVEPTNIITYVYDKDFRPESIGAVNVHYYTGKLGSDSYNEIDHVQDHGLSGTKFVLNPYEDDLPSELNNQYYRNTKSDVTVTDNTYTDGTKPVTGKQTISNGDTGREETDTHTHNGIKYDYVDFNGDSSKPLNVYIPIESDN